MELRDKNGLTEKEFLAAYKPGDFPRPSVTADNLIFAKDGDCFRLLMIKRGGHPCLGMWALPGGFSNPDETVDSAAARELEEETGITGLQLEQLGLFSTPNRDPRTWVMTCAFVSIAEMSDIKAGDDADDARWFKVSLCDGILTLDGGDVILTAKADISGGTALLSEKVTILENNGFAFDHAEIITKGILKLRRCGINI